MTVIAIALLLLGLRLMWGVFFRGLVGEDSRGRPSTGSLPPEETIQAKWEMRAGIAAVVAGAVIGLIELIR